MSTAYATLTSLPLSVHTSTEYQHSIFPLPDRFCLDSLSSSSMVPTTTAIFPQVNGTTDDNASGTDVQSHPEHKQAHITLSTPVSNGIVKTEKVPARLASHRNPSLYVTPGHTVEVRETEIPTPAQTRLRSMSGPPDYAAQTCIFGTEEQSDRWWSAAHTFWATKPLASCSPSARPWRT